MMVLCFCRRSATAAGRVGICWVRVARVEELGGSHGTVRKGKGMGKLGRVSRRAWKNRVGAGSEDVGQDSKSTGESRKVSRRVVT